MAADYTRLQLVTTSEKGPDAGSGEPPYHGDMNARISVLESRLDTVLPTLATKADVTDAKGVVIQHVDKGTLETQRWMIATVIGLFLGFGGLFLAMSNAIKPASQQSQPIINVQPATTPPAAK